MNYIVYDLEATCWQNEWEARGKQREIIEIGAVLIDENGLIQSRFESFVQPIRQPILSNFCQELTSISQADVSQADEFPRVISDFKDWIGLNAGEEYLLCSWGFFDKAALVKDCEFHGLDGRWAKKHISLKHQYLRIIHSMREVGLESALAQEGFEFEGTMHRAIDDAVNLAKIFQKYFNLWRF